MKNHIAMSARRNIYLSGLLLACLLASLLASLALGACSQRDSGQLEIAPGAKGTILAVGTATSLSIEGESAIDGPFTFNVSQSKSPNVSMGEAIGGAKPKTDNETKAFIPASITKVITTMLALKHLGPDFRFKTEVVWDENPAQHATAANLTVFADGDPQIGRIDDAGGPTRARLTEMARQLKNMGVARVTGPVRMVSTDPRADIAAPPDGMDAEDNLACYGARVQAFNFRRNCAELAVAASGAAHWDDGGILAPLRVEVTGKDRSTSVVPRFDAGSALDGYIIRIGAAGATPVSLSLPVSDVKSWFGAALLKEFARNGIDVSQAQLVIPTPAESAELIAGKDSRAGRLTLLSDPMADLIRYMCKPSDNFLADALFKAIARIDGAADIRAAGAAVVQAGVDEWMQREGHPEYSHEIHLIDGAGLSRSNHVSPRAFLALLHQFSLEPGFSVLWRGLPIAGVDGTLKNRMKGTAAEGVVHAKTGTLRGAYQLAGYVPRMAGGGKILEYIPFVILSDTTPANRFEVHDFQNRVVARLAEEINGKH